MSALPSGRDTASRAIEVPPSTIHEEQVERIISVTGNLPPLPHVAARVMQLVANEATSVRDLQRVIAAEPALTARILQTANSVFYSFDRKIPELGQAIEILGFPAVQSMAIATSAHHLFVKEPAEFGLKEKLLWDHAVGVATGCRQIARTVGFENQESAFLVGLLHDIGKTVLNQAIPKKYGRIAEQACNDGCPLTDAEQDVLGFDHSHVSALTAQKWSFDQDVVETIASHHRPEAQTNGVLASVLALSNHLCKRMGIGFERLRDRGALADHWSAATLGLDENACREIQEVVRTGLEEEKKLFAA